MNRFRALAAGSLLSTALIVFGQAHAMEIRQYDKMADQDKSEYIGNLIVGAENVLSQSGKPDLAAQVKRMFATKGPGDADAIGMVEFEKNLALAGIEDALQDANARRLEVEDAMIVTLKKHGIELPASFLTVGSNFKPKFQPAARPPSPTAPPVASRSNPPDDDDPFGPGGFITPPDR